MRLQFGLAGMFLLVLVSACVIAASRAISRSYVSGNEWQNVQGMAASEVRQVLGEPDTIEHNGSNEETWIYQAGFGIMGVEFNGGRAQGGWYD